MDMGCLSLSVWIIICLVESAPCSSEENCPEVQKCPKIPPWPQTQTPADTGKCFKLLDRFRYNCTQGYVRRVGTSNLTICKNTTGKLNWTKPTLVCIPHPDSPRPTNSTPETSTSVRSYGTVSPTPLINDMTNGTQPMSKEILTNTTHTTAQTSTLSPVTDNSIISSIVLSPAEKVSIGLTMLIAICSMVGLSFLLYRRRSRSSTPERSAQEMEELKPALQQAA